MVKLDTGNVFNITDRDHYILNLSTQNVEMITGNVNPFEIPEQVHQSDIEDEEDIDEAILDIEEDIEKDMAKSLSSVVNDMLDGVNEDNIGTITGIIKKIGFKL
jgi:hypothetical protein